VLASSIQRLIDHGWQRAGLEPPKLWPRERRLIARTIRNRVALPDDAGPKAIARALGMTIHCLPVSGCGELTDGKRLIYRHHPDPATRRLYVAHGLAHAVLVLDYWDHSEADALLLTLDFV
jgi:hypothetical protein